MTYRLCLGDENDWMLVGGMGAGPWLDRFAGIAGLCPANGSHSRRVPRIFFVQEAFLSDRRLNPENLGPLVPPDLPKHGWEAHQLPPTQFWTHGDTADIVYEIGPVPTPDSEIVAIWMFLHIVYVRAMERGGAPTHAGLVECNGRALLVVGPGGAGKSTLCARLGSPWRALSDDQTLVLRNGGGYTAHPIPTWSRYLWGGEETKGCRVEQGVPLAAFLFLEKAERDELEPLGAGRAAIRLVRSSTDVCLSSLRRMPAEEAAGQRKRMFENCCELVRAVPSYILHATRGGPTWEQMEKVLR